MVDHVKQLQKIRRLIDDAMERRNAEIRAAYEAGVKQGDIANAVGLSRMQVSRILNPKE